jgi:hypothetical protein
VKVDYILILWLSDLGGIKRGRVKSTLITSSLGESEFEFEIPKLPMMYHKCGSQLTHGKGEENAAGSWRMYYVFTFLSALTVEHIRVGDECALRCSPLKAQRILAHTLTSHAI